MDPSYVGRVIKLTALPPRLIEDIVDGLEKLGTSLEQLEKAMPVVWEQNRLDETIS